MNVPKKQTHGSLKREWLRRMAKVSGLVTRLLRTHPDRSHERRQALLESL